MRCILADVTNQSKHRRFKINYTQNEKIEQVTGSTLVVGLDIGSQIHYARAFDNRGRELTKRVLTFQNDIEGFNLSMHGLKNSRQRIIRLPF